MFKKRNLLNKLWLKYTDRAGYKNYKWDLINYKNIKYKNFLLGANRLTSLSKIKKLVNETHTLNISHSGNAGDIIYALPTIKKIRELTNADINLYLILGKPLKLPNYNTHPLGKVMLNNTMADMLLPLIRQQTYINKCDTYKNENIDLDLDYIRSGLIQLDKGNIARWCGYITGINPNLYDPWLKVRPDKSYLNSIIVARSGRYQNKNIDYSVLREFNNLVFIGVQSEYDDIKKCLPRIRWQQFDNFYQMATVIAGCKFFIGNQSFPYSIAEGLKVPRILEVAFEVINVVPEGKNAYDFLFQDHFEDLINTLNNV